jgi:hypothetical protein
MDKDKAIEEIQFIKKIISDSRKLYFDDGIIHILWSSVALIGTSITYTFVYLELYLAIPVLWVVITIVAVSITIYIKSKIYKNRPQNFAGKIYGATWKSVGLGIVFFFLLTIPVESAGLSIRLAVIPLMLGTAYFISAQIGIYKWMNYIAIGWWAVTGAVILSPDMIAPAVLAGATVPLQLIPGIYLLKSHHLDKSDE